MWCNAVQQALPNASQGESVLLYAAVLPERKKALCTCRTTAIPASVREEACSAEDIAGASEGKKTPDVPGRENWTTWLRTLRASTFFVVCEIDLCIHAQETVGRLVGDGGVSVG